jgi:Domain of unknown function (DUF1835)/Protein of unknown function
MAQTPKRGKRIHLVSGMAAGGLVDDACRSYGLGGDVLAIDDYLDVGPLVAADARRVWWKPIYDMYLAGLSDEMPDVEDQWRGALSAGDAAGDVVVWTSDSANDQTFLRLAATKLSPFAGRLRLVHVPTWKGMAGVSRFYPDRLAACGRRSIAFDATMLSSLAREYEEHLRGSEGVRFQTDEGLSVRDYSAFDQELLDACPAEFVNPARVVGTAMSRWDGRNWVPDMFLRWRLRGLVELGSIKATGEHWFVDSCDIRVSR